MAKNLGGRPTKMTKEVLKKLEQAFLIGCTDEEAAFAAKISPPILYAYQKKHPEFQERKEQLKKNPVYLARQSVIKHMKKDGGLAMKYLERKRKNEFSTKTKAEIEHTGNMSLTSILQEIDGTSAGLPTE